MRLRFNGVPLGRYFECRLLKVTNQDTKKRNRKAFRFVEYANNWSTWQNTVNLQYTLNILGIQAFIYTLKKADFFFRVLPVSVGYACHGIHRDFHHHFFKILSDYHVVKNVVIFAVFKADHGCGKIEKPVCFPPRTLRKTDSP
jgi:hypothetical protein